MRFTTTFAALAAVTKLINCAPIDAVNTTVSQPEYGPHPEKRDLYLMGFAFMDTDFRGEEYRLWARYCHNFRETEWENKISSYQIKDYAVCYFDMETYDCRTEGPPGTVLEVTRRSYMLNPEFNDRTKSIRCRFARGWDEWGNPTPPTTGNAIEGGAGEGSEERDG